ncbi:MAG: hypothetical protein KDA89_05585 [Planctomycetaceae bacterium]|nr:hypothetical protein [Planctomycetaceae bacterium]
MLNAILPSARTGDDVTPDLPQFFETVQRYNPFRRSRISAVPAAIRHLKQHESRNDGFVDVVEIHGAEFRRLLGAVGDANGTTDGLGIMVMGDAGVGKSHLLARLCMAVESQKLGCAVFLHNLIASPEGMPRHFLRTVVSLLTDRRQSYRGCRLYRLLFQSVQSIWNVRGGGKNRGGKVQSTRLRRVFVDEMMNSSLSAGSRFDEVIFDVLFTFFQHINRERRLTDTGREQVGVILDWLSGNAISVEAAQAVGIPVHQRDFVRIEDGGQLIRVLIALSQLCAVSGERLLICLDQVDNLAQDQMQSLSQFLHSYIDAARNLVIVSAGVTEKMNSIRENGGISVAQWARVAERVVALPYSSPEEARELIFARLHPVKERFCSVPELRKLFADHGMFPIPEKEFELRFGSSVNLRLRSVLSWAGESWYDQQEQIDRDGGPAWLKSWNSDPTDVVTPEADLEEVIDAVVVKALNEAIAERRESRGAIPADADNLAAITEKILRTCVLHGGYSVSEVRRISPGTNALPSYHLKVTRKLEESAEVVPSGVAFVTTSNGNSAHAALNRLKNVQGRLDRRVLVTDEERMPLPQSPMAVQRYAELQSLSDGFVHIKLSFQLCAEPDALLAVIDEAGEIDIECPRGSYRSLTTDEVVDSLFRLGRLLKHPLLCELLTGRSNESEITPDSPSAELPTPELIELMIRGKLGFHVCTTTNELTVEILGRREFSILSFDAVHALVVQTATSLSTAGKVLAKEHGDGLLLMNLA